MKLSRLYAARFSPEDKARRNRIWQVLCRHFFQDYVDSSDTVLDIGAGNCEFINHIICRIALDLSGEVRKASAWRPIRGFAAKLVPPCCSSGYDTGDCGMGLSGRLSRLTCRRARDSALPARCSRSGGSARRRSPPSRAADLPPRPAALPGSRSSGWE